MRKILVLSILTSLMFFSCKKSDTNKTAFTNTAMKTLFDSNCKNCHGKNASAQGSWLYDASDYNGSIKAHINSLYSSIYTRKNMPQGANLSQSDLNAFKAWYDAGYPAN